MAMGEYNPSPGGPASGYNYGSVYGGGAKYGQQSQLAQSNYGQIGQSAVPIYGMMIDFIAGWQTSQDLGQSSRELYRQAALALQEGFTLGEDITQEGREFVGEMTVAFGKSGSLLEGSPLLALADTNRQIEKNALRVIEQGRINERLLRLQGDRARRAGYMKKVETIGNYGGGFGKLIAGGAMGGGG